MNTGTVLIILAGLFIATRKKDETTTGAGDILDFQWKDSDGVWHCRDSKGNDVDCCLDEEFNPIAPTDPAWDTCYGGPESIADFLP